MQWTSWDRFIHMYTKCLIQGKKRCGQNKIVPDIVILRRFLEKTLKFHIALTGWNVCTLCTVTAKTYNKNKFWRVQQICLFIEQDVMGIFTYYFYVCMFIRMCINVHAFRRDLAENYGWSYFESNSLYPRTFSHTHRPIHSCSIVLDVTVQFVCSFMQTPSGEKWLNPDIIFPRFTRLPDFYFIKLVCLYLLYQTKYLIIYASFKRLHFLCVNSY